MTGTDLASSLSIAVSNSSVELFSRIAVLILWSKSIVAKLLHFELTPPHIINFCPLSLASCISCINISTLPRKKFTSLQLKLYPFLFASIFSSILNRLIEANSSSIIAISEKPAIFEV